MVCFFKKIYSVHVDREASDGIVWRGGRLGKFSVKSFYKPLVGMQISSFPTAKKWVPRVPSRIAFFTWVACWGKCLTLHKLQKRGSNLASTCVLCKSKEEWVDHLLIHCSVAREVWNSCLDLFHVQWVMPRTDLQVVESWHYSNSRQEVHKVWRMVLYAVFWSFWTNEQKNF